MFEKITLVLLFIVLLTSCGREANEKVIVHPIKDKMAHSDYELTLLHINYPGEALNVFPENLKLLQRFLNEGNDDEFIKTELSVLTTNNIDISSINDSTFLILENNNNRLIQYDIKKNNYEIVANQGRGPGDLFFAKELSTYMDKAIVGMQGFQISIFNCSNGQCEFERTLKTDYSNYSVAPTDDHIYFLGISPFGNQQDPDPLNADYNLIQKINYQGDLLLSFHPIYNDRSPLVRERMSSGGMVRSYPGAAISLVIFDFFPFIYEYGTDGELTGKFEIPNFIQAKYESEENRGGGFTSRLIYGSNTNIDLTSKVDERWLFIRLRERRDVEYDQDKGFLGDEWYSYLAYDIVEKKLFKLGDDKIKSYGESRVLHALDQGIVVNKDGILTMITR